MEIDLRCGGVNLTGWLQQVQPDGAAALAAFAAERLPGDATGWNTLSTAPAAAAGSEPSGCLCGKRESGFPALAPAEAQAYLNELVDGYFAGDVAAAAAALAAVAPG
ncbi:hypothetical protein MJ561_23730 [Klebsiella pneumoniae]|nr:hypothetical protein MJ561_23730 [Klebsiella pneumoniae]